MGRPRATPPGSPVSLLAQVRGFTRDYPLDALPEGYLWDVCDFLINKRGRRLAYRAGYINKGTAFPAASTGGLHAAFQAGSKLIMESSGTLYDVNPADGTRTAVGTPGFGLAQNGVLLRDRAYFFNKTPGATVPYYVTWNGSAWTPAALGASAPKASVGIAYKERLVVAGAGDQKVYFSPLETNGGPPGTWESGPTDKSWIATSNKVNALAAMASQILVFHDGSIERIRGVTAPALGVNTDMYLDTLSEHVGCPWPASICHWQENVIFADLNGVQMTDGSAVRCLTDQGGLHAYWYDMVSKLRAGTQVHCEVIQDQLFVFVPCTFSSSTVNRSDYPSLLICDLMTRTWSRFSNVYPSCFIPLVTGIADIAWCGDGYAGSLGYDAEIGSRAITPSPLKLAFISPMLVPQDPKDPNAAISLLQQYDGDGDPVLPHLETGWVRLGGDLPKQFVDLYCSHQLQVDNAISATIPVAQLSFTVEPLVSFMNGSAAFPILPGNFYTRDRFDMHDAGYGVRVAYDGVAAVGVGALFDIQVDTTAKDVGSLR